MIVKDAVLKILLISLLPLSSQAQDKDAGAVAVLAKMTAVTGWTATNTPVDAVIHANQVRISEGVERSFPVLIQLKQNRFKVRSESGVITTFDGTDMSVQSADGERAIARHSAVSVRPLPVPLFSEIPFAVLGQYEIRLLASEVVNGESCDHILIQPKLEQTDISDVLKRTKRLRLWISQKTYLPVQMSYTRVTESNPTAMFERFVRFSDYRRAGGIIIPFQLDEHSSTRLLHSVRITDMQLNVGLSDSEFSLPTSEAK